MWEPGYEDSHREWREDYDQWQEEIGERETMRLEIGEAAKQEEIERLAEAERARDEK